MIDVAATLRRALVVIGAVLVGGLLVRPQLSSALVTRGDALAFQGNAERARIMYARAMLLDARNGVAEDRLLFAEVMTHRRTSEFAAIREATAYLRERPDDLRIRFDRALARQIVKRYADAARDFASIGRARGDARALTFAGIDALHAGESARACRWLREALRLDRGDVPARRALARLRT